MAKRSDEIIHINVSGKKFTVRRSELCAEQHTKLYEWFKQGSMRAAPQDKSGHFFLNRDGKSFRYILSFLRYKKEKMPQTMALPSKPDELARFKSREILELCHILLAESTPWHLKNLSTEASALGLTELKDMCLEMLQRYQREEAGYNVAFVNAVLRDFDSWTFENKEASSTTKSSSKYDDWDN